MKKTLAILALVACVGAIAQKVTTSTTSEYEGSAFSWQYSCGGLTAEKWDDRWHKADCMEIATSLSNLRDYRNVGVQSTPNVADMLTYEQYAYHFEIERKDFTKAQDNCRKLLTEGHAHPEILAQCKRTVAGVVPYGLKLRAP